MEINIILDEVKRKISVLYGKRLRQIILYGSWARGDADDNSDIDLMIVLSGKVSPGKEIDRMIDTIYEIALKHDTLIAIYPVSEKELQCSKGPVLLNVKREGIAV
ncbi:MAG: nucleotidyltransferase domain-containing protein [Candidatus Eremiobacteraeota bacterium]|nr:nucleotidyltransferase domain-containing protein [Candidatus Eremiobacteraeota bacterium]